MFRGTAKAIRRKDMQLSADHLFLFCGKQTLRIFVEVWFVVRLDRPGYRIIVWNHVVYLIVFQQCTVHKKQNVG